MSKALRNRWKRICAMLLAAAMVITMMPSTAMAGTSSDLGDGTFQNPVIYSDVPDLDMIRVGDAYYMISTTMHLSPGCPVMKSTDLVNWEIVNYVFDRLGTDDAMSLRNGKNMYGNGQWAASLQYHDGLYYVAFNSNTTGRAYIYTTTWRCFLTTMGRLIYSTAEPRLGAWNWRKTFLAQNQGQKSSCLIPTRQAKR